MKKAKRAIAPLLGLLLAACFLAAPAAAAGNAPDIVALQKPKSGDWSADAAEYAANMQQRDQICRDADAYYYQKRDNTGYLGKTYRLPVEMTSPEKEVPGSDAQTGTMRLLTVADGFLYYGWDDEEAMQYRVFILPTGGGTCKEIASFDNRRAEVLPPLYCDGALYIAYFTSQKDAFYPYDWTAGDPQDAKTVVLRCAAGKKSKAIFECQGRAEQFFGAEDHLLYLAIEQMAAEYSMLRVNAATGKSQKVCYAKARAYDMRTWADASTGRIDHCCFYADQLAYALLVNDARDEAALYTIDFDKGVSAVSQKTVPGDVVRAMLGEDQLGGAPYLPGMPLITRDRYFMTLDAAGTLHRTDFTFAHAEIQPLGEAVDDPCVIDELFCTWRFDDDGYRFYLLAGGWVSATASGATATAAPVQSTPLSDLLPEKVENIRYFSDQYKGYPLGYGGNTYSDALMLFVDRFPNNGTTTYIPDLKLSAEYAEGALTYRLGGKYSAFTCTIGCQDQPQKFIGPPKTHGYSRIRFLADGKCIGDTGWFDYAYEARAAFDLSGVKLFKIELQQVTGLNDAYYALNLLLANALLS